MNRVTLVSLVSAFAVVCGILVQTPARAGEAAQLSKWQVSLLLLTRSEIAQATGVDASVVSGPTACRTAADLGSNYCYYSGFDTVSGTATTEPVPTELGLHSFKSNRNVRDYFARVRRGIPQLGWTVLESSRNRLVAVDPPSPVRSYRTAYVYQANGTVLVVGWCAHKWTNDPTPAVTCAKNLSSAQWVKVDRS